MDAAAEPDRRPIAARNWKFSHRLAAVLVRWRVSPNAISLGGMICGLLAGTAFGLTTQVSDGLRRAAFAAAALFIQLRLLANMLDGMVALGAGRVSATGELYNEVPDRISDAAILIGAGYAAGGSVEMGYGAACVALFTAYVRAVGKAAGAGNDFRGPMAKPHRMFLMTVLALFVAAVPADWCPSFGPRDAWGPIAFGLLVVVVLGLGTSLRRLLGIAARLRAAARRDREETLP